MNFIKKAIGIIIFGFFSLVGITQRNAVGGENNIYFGIICGLIAISLLLSLFKKGKKKINPSDSNTCFQTEYSNHFSEEYLNQVLPNGKTIREEKQKNWGEVLSSPNLRTDEEENLISDFYTKFEQTLTLAEEKLYQLANDIGQGKTLDERILKVRKVISHYEHFKSFCYSKGLGGQMYFQDMWEHCHNSKNSDFDYIDQFKELLENWTAVKLGQDEMASIRKQILTLIKENPGILQKEIYSHFNPDSKTSIRGEMMQLEANGNIKRIKHGNTYELYIS